MSSAVVKLSVPISSCGPHLPQFLYFSAASRRSCRVSFLPIAFPHLLRPARARRWRHHTTKEGAVTTLIRGLTIAFALLAAGQAAAQSYPSRPVRLIVPF